jgi:hypothetical protein
MIKPFALPTFEQAIPQYAQSGLTPAILRFDPDWRPVPGQSTIRKDVGLVRTEHKVITTMRRVTEMIRVDGRACGFPAIIQRIFLR